MAKFDFKDLERFLQNDTDLSSVQNCCKQIALQLGKCATMDNAEYIRKASHQLQIVSDMIETIKMVEE